MVKPMCIVEIQAQIMQVLPQNTMHIVLATVNVFPYILSCELSVHPWPPHSLQEICCENVNIWSFKYPEQIDVIDTRKIYVTIIFWNITLINSPILAFVTFLLVLVLWLYQQIYPKSLLFSSTSSWWSGVNSIAWMRRLILLTDFDCI